MNVASGHLPMNHGASTQVPAWAWALAAAALFAVFLILQENGIFVSSANAEWLHEFTHDGRHAIGVPCD